MVAEPSSLHDDDDLIPPAAIVPKKRPGGWRTVVRRIGQGLIASGLLVLLFVAYELWGTNIWTKRAQNRLRTEFSTQIAPAPTPAALGPAGPGPAGPVAPPPPPPDAVLLPATGDALARLVILRIDVDVIVVEGVDPAALRDGPGHYPGTPLPGEDGNVVISGHRTTYGAPFHNLDKLAEGDQFRLISKHGDFLYQVQWTRIVSPSDVSVTESTVGLNEVTLTTCHPKFSASQRLIIRATQVGGPRALAGVS